MIAMTKPIGSKDRARVFELASQMLSVRDITERTGISSQTIRTILAKGLRRCTQCGRLIDTGDACPACALPAAAPLADRLKAFRTVAAVAQMVLALRIGVDVKTVRAWEKGQAQPGEHGLKLLAEALGITVQELTGRGESLPGDQRLKDPEP